MKIGNDTEGDQLFSPAAVFLLVGIGCFMYAAVDDIPPAELGQRRIAGTASLIAGAVILAFAIAVWVERCRSVISDEGIEFVPAKVFGHLTFRWADVRGWSWVTIESGDGDNASVSRHIAIELKDGTTHEIPQRHCHRLIASELNRRVGPSDMPIR